MKLTQQQIVACLSGASRVIEEDNGIRLSRFTEEQEELYRSKGDALYTRSLSAAGVRLCFKTNSESVCIRGLTAPGSSRKYYSFEVYVNGSQVGYIDNYSQYEMPRFYSTFQGRMGPFSGYFDLGSGDKEVSIYFPWSAKVTLGEISLDDGAFVEPMKRVKKLLAFGDSITQGYDALRNPNRYISRLADALEAEEINKAVGSEIFCPQLASLKDDISPDYITIAYGSNDWYKIEEAEFQKNCKAFYQTIRQQYPNATIFAISPIWRKEYLEKTRFESFGAVEAYIQKTVGDIGNIHFISGFDFVPHTPELFADGRLHPNDVGFSHQFENLYTSIRNILS